jgi:predicted dehydrogenase/threonine dehydrogenase-like Zn-dependent dehydrogenase
MKQLYQSYRTGALAVVDVPEPLVSGGRLLVRTEASLVSAGTERAMIELARKSLLGKALARPDLVRRVVDTARTEGVAEAYRQATGRLDAPVPLGYSSAGVVVEVGAGVGGFLPGDRVACTGAGVAGHAETNLVPATLCAKLPPGVSFESGAFAALGGIALEAVRVAHAGLGDRVVVIGLGLIGQLAVQILRAAGCHVFGIDVVPDKVAMALAAGAEAGATTGTDDVASLVRDFTDGHGADAAIILASGGGNAPLEQAAELVRERGRVVATGLVGLDVPRTPFYDKELELVVSRAWGPGLYDPRYAERAEDYPLPYARWTAGRNIAEFLALVGRKAVDVERLITHRFGMDRALEAYELITTGAAPHVGVVLIYAGRAAERDRVVRVAPPPAGHPARAAGHGVGVGLIGAGLFAKGTLLPALKGVDGLAFRGVATATGLTGRDVAARFGFEYATTDYRELLADPACDAVLIATRHDLHARLVVEALAAGKHVFVEKPLALTPEELAAVDAARRAPPGAVVAVGFNRRFSPFTMQVRRWLQGVREPLVVTCRVNAGPVRADSWVHDPAQGGGRIVGELCHFLDLVQALTGADPVRVQAETLRSAAHRASDNVVATVTCADGSVASIAYVATGDKGFPRERIEVFGGGAVAVIDNFRSAYLRARGRERRRLGANVDRGHRAELEAFVGAIRRGGPSPVPFERYLATTRATFALEEALRTGGAVRVEASCGVAPEDGRP